MDVEELLNSTYNNADYSDEIKERIKLKIEFDRIDRKFTALRLGLDFNNDITEKCLIFTDK